MYTIFLHGFSGDSDGLAPLIESVGYPKSFGIDLPGFGQNMRTTARDWDCYVEEVMESLVSLSGKHKCRLVGHSHGAMVAYALATKYPEKISEIVLICPIVRGTRLGRSFIQVNDILRALLGDSATLGIHKKQRIVDTVTKLSVRSDWPAGAYVQLREMRRAEAARYSKEMLDVLKLIPQFEKTYHSSLLTGDAKLLFAHGDLLVSKYDRDWYQKHIPKAEIFWCRGGHVAPVIFPRDIAEVIKPSEVIA